MHNTDSTQFSFQIKSNEEGLKQKNSNIFYQYMDVVSVKNCKTTEKGEIPGIEISEKNFDGIKVRRNFMQTGFYS